ncbi:transketolase [Demequina sp.]|uniref:transketolase n=1 Tax=Demequina sp. TaxID=2050685 RepID=UPI0025BDC4C1|nr:transketolase [Demequina sp.]
MAGLAWEDMDKRAVDTARVLAADAVEKAGHGHPGTAMTLAPVAYLLYQRIMRHDPADGRWLGRDRFVLSAGHASLTQYVQLFLGGFGLELDDLRALRTAGSLTPGHPEYGHTDGVEITTGPLGQGLASAVGFACAARYERGLFDPEAAPGTSPFDHHIYVIASDGDLQEGISAEASSFAGHQELGNLVVIYDANQISIEDDTDVAFTEDVAQRYASYGWDVQTVQWRRDGAYVEDVHGLNDAIAAAKADTARPSIIILRTIIGWPSPGKQNTGSVHGAKLGDAELKATKRALGWDPDQSFVVDDTVLAHTRELAQRSRTVRDQWQSEFDAWAERHPERKSLLDRLMSGQLPEGIESLLPHFEPGTSIATRAASGAVINALAAPLPELWGGSADLADSNLTTIHDAASFNPTRRGTAAWPADPYGRVLHFGIREHAMAAILNGIVLHGPTRVFGGTFLIFSDYMRPSVRLAALMGIPSIFVWTHDSMGLGEDGPTHQPVEHLASLRLIPHLAVARPADADEVSAVWLEALRRTNGPTGIVLTRQAVPVPDRAADAAQGLAPAQLASKGAYVLADAPQGRPDIIVIATGSEVQLALSAREILAREGVEARVVSAPCLEWFAEQTSEYRNAVLPPDVKARVAVEAGAAGGWREFTGDAGEIVSINEYGASASGPELFERFDITVGGVVSAAHRCLERLRA